MLISLQCIYIDNQKVQVADESKRDIWKYLVSSDVEDDAWYNYMCNISSCIELIPSYSFYIPEVWHKRYIDNQKVQVANEIKRDIWKYLVSSDVANDAWYNYVCCISSCVKQIPSYSFYMPEFW